MKENISNNCWSKQDNNPAGGLAKYSNFYFVKLYRKQYPIEFVVWKSQKINRDSIVAKRNFEIELQFKTIHRHINAQSDISTKQIHLSDFYLF